MRGFGVLGTSTLMMTFNPFGVAAVRVGIVVCWLPLCGACRQETMSESEQWNEQSRTDLRETLRSNILGELRLGKRGKEEILSHCREVYIDDECPEEERETFVQFADVRSAPFSSEPRPR